MAANWILHTLLVVGAVLYAQGMEMHVCSNVRMSVNCPAGILHIKEVVAGVSPCADNEDECCPSADDCMVPLESVNKRRSDFVYNSCMMQGDCGFTAFQTLIRRPACRRTSYSDYTKVSYNCVTEMHDMCMDGVKNGNSGYISSPQFPNMLVNGQEYDCSCKLMADSPTMLNVTAAKLKMEGNADGVCETAEEHKQVLDVKVGGAQHMSKQCISKYNEVLYSGEIQDGTPLELHFLSNLLREGGHFWINYEASGPVTLQCGKTGALPSIPPTTETVPPTTVPSTTSPTTPSSTTAQTVTDDKGEVQPEPEPESTLAPKDAVKSTTGSDSTPSGKKGGQGSTPTPVAPVEPTKLQTVHVDVKGSTAEPVVVEKEDAASSTSEGESGAVIGAVIAIVVLLIVAIIIAIFLYRRRKNQRKGEGKDAEEGQALKENNKDENHKDDDDDTKVAIPPPATTETGTNEDDEDKKPNLSSSSQDGLYEQPEVIGEPPHTNGGDRVHKDEEPAATTENVDDLYAKPQKKGDDNVEVAPPVENDKRVSNVSEEHYDPVDSAETQPIIANGGPQDTTYDEVNYSPADQQQQQQQTASAPDSSQQAPLIPQA